MYKMDNIYIYISFFVNIFKLRQDNHKNNLLTFVLI